MRKAPKLSERFQIALFRSDWASRLPSPIRLDFLPKILFPPLQDLVQAVHAQVRGPGTAEAVARARRVADKPRRHFAKLEGHKNLLGLLDVTTQIALAVDNQCRRLDV